MGNQAKTLLDGIITYIYHRDPICSTYKNEKEKETVLSSSLNGNKLFLPTTLTLPRKCTPLPTHHYFFIEYQFCTMTFSTTISRHSSKRLLLLPIPTFLSLLSTLTTNKHMKFFIFYTTESTKNDKHF